MTWHSAPSSASAISMTQGVVQELHEVGVAIEGVVDRPVEEAAFRVGTAIEALGQRLQALHVPAQFRHLIAIEHPGEVDVPVPLDGVDLTRQVRLGYQRQGLRHRFFLLNCCVAVAIERRRQHGHAISLTTAEGRMATINVRRLDDEVVRRLRRF